MSTSSSQQEVSDSRSSVDQQYDEEYGEDELDESSLQGSRTHLGDDFIKQIVIENNKSEDGSNEDVVKKKISGKASKIGNLSQQGKEMFL